MKHLVFLLIMLSASVISPSPNVQGKIVWNVGQGQWVTFIEGSVCYHFDMGGEFFPWKRLRDLCGTRENKVLLSHWDWDHIGALGNRRLSKILPDLCILVPPGGTGSKNKKALLARFPHCVDDERNIEIWKPAFSKTSNESSQVFSYHHYLMPGDSTMKQEKIWHLKSWIHDARVLVLGHHGSKTSTSSELLQSLPKLQMAVSSARWRRYSHPHSETIVRLRLAHVPLLRTEDWGNIWFE